MNRKTLIIPIFFSWICLAADTSSTSSSSSSTSSDSSSDTNTISNESSNNQVLYNNVNVTSGTAKDTYSAPLGGSNTASTVNASNLTDEQKQLKENFVHQGLAARKLKEQCEGETNTAICNGQDPKANKKVMVQALSKAYAMFGGMVGEKFMGFTKPAAKKDGADDSAKDSKETKDSTADSTKDSKDAKDGKDKTENQTDYCRYIPMATETVSTFNQQMSAQALSSTTSTGETAQKETLMKSARSHEERAKGSNIQATGWGATAACYVGMAAFNTTLPSQGNWWVKMGAATFLAKFYVDDASENKEYAAKTRKIADSLPGKGDCNPISDLACYCAQEETANDTIYCKPTLHQKTVGNSSFRISCVDQNLKNDPGCNCDKTGTCYDKVLNVLDTSSSLGIGTAGSEYSPIKKLTNGELTSGVLNGNLASQYQAIAKKKLANAQSVPKTNGDLSSAERELASIYQSSGLPANVAAMMAKTPVSQSAMQSAMDKVSGLVNDNSLMATNGANNYKSKILDYTSGSGLSAQKKNGKSGNDDLKNVFSNLNPNKKAENPNNNKIIEFAVQKAQSQNQIMKSDASIFQIISNRYMNSAAKRLELEPKNDSVPASNQEDKK